jgi:hypothetical protein
VLQPRQTHYSNYDPNANWRTLVGDYFQAPNAENGDEPCQAEQKDWWTHFRLFLTHQTLPLGTWFQPLSDEEFSNATRYRQAVVHNMCCYRYFSTTGGRVGLGSLNMQPGEAVCVFRGAKVAHVVRFEWSGKGRANGARRTTGKLIRDAYVHGLMYAQVYEMDAEEETIILE